MRTHHAAVLAAALALPTAAAGQDDAKYWPLRDINFPVPVDRITASGAKPAKLRFHVRPEGQAWREAAAAAPDALDLIDRDGNRRGFKYTSPADGAYDFALQVEAADGAKRPADADLKPEYRVVFDTRPPVVTVTKVGATGIDWDVADDNLRDDGIQIEARWVRIPGRPVEARKFVPIRPGFKPKPRDTYTVAGIKPGEVLEVRVVARDKANHETPSPPVTLQLAGGGEDPLPDAEPVGRADRDRVAAAPSPAIEYSASKQLEIVSKVQKVTRSGVAKSHLWARSLTTNWAKVGEQAEAIPAGQEKPVIKWKYAAPTDGRYGFIVIPENGAGGRDPDPRDADPAQFLIQVDTVAPKVTAVAAAPRAGAAGPQVDVTWKATDDNLPSLPVKVEWSKNPAPAGPWATVHPDRPTLPNTGRYSWAVPDDFKEWKFFVRVTATDLAGLSGDGVTATEVKIDLDTPKAVIDRVTADGGKAGSQGPAASSVVPTTLIEPPQQLPPVQPPKPDLPKPAPGPEPSGSLPPSAPPLPPPPATPNPVGGPGVPTLPPGGAEAKKVEFPGVAVPLPPGS